MHKPSKELWQILENNGFKNVSYHFAKHHHNFYKGTKDLYNPKVHRLAFSSGKGISKFVLFFEYMDIEIVFGGRNKLLENANLLDSELRSIIAFFKMPYYRKYSIADATDCSVELSSKILEETKEKYGYEFPFDKKFEDAFSEIKI